MFLISSWLQNDALGLPSCNSLGAKPEVPVDRRVILQGSLLLALEEHTEGASGGASTALASLLPGDTAATGVGDAVVGPLAATDGVTDGVVGDAHGAEHVGAPPVVLAHVGVDSRGRVDTAALGDGPEAVVTAVAMTVDGGTTEGTVPVATVVDAVATTTVLATGTVGTSHASSELSLEETETTAVGSGDAEGLAASSGSVGTLALLAGSDEALHHHLTQEGLLAVASELTRLDKLLLAVLLDGTLAREASTLGVADLHGKIVLGGAKVSLGLGDDTAAMVHNTLGRLPGTRAEEHGAGALTERLVGEVPTDTGTTGLAEVRVGSVELTLTKTDGVLGTVDEVLVAAGATTAIVKTVEGTLGVLDLLEHVVDGRISGLHASGAASAGIHLEHGLDTGLGSGEGVHFGALLDELSLLDGSLGGGGDERNKDQRFHHHRF